MVIQERCNRRRSSFAMALQQLLDHGDFEQIFETLAAYNSYDSHAIIAIKQ
jgi:hypothetical protein